MKKAICLLVGFILLAYVFAGCGGGGKKEYIVPVYADDKVMEIGAWDAPAFFRMSQEGFNEVADAGFTLVYINENVLDFGNPKVTTPAQAVEYLDRAQNAGLKAVIVDSAFCKPIYASDPSTYDQGPADKSFMKYYKDHPAFAGLRISDEPMMLGFSGVKFKLDEFKENFPGKIGYVNTYPNEQDDFSQGHMEGLLKDVGVQFASYDHYVLMSDGSLRENYFKYLEYVKTLAVKYGVPAHNFLLTAGHSTATSVYRKASEEEIRWQVACDLVYGYDWFTHYCYHPLDPSYDPFVTQDGKLTELHRKVKTVNGEMHKWDHVYLSFEWQGVAPILGDNTFKNYMFDYLSNGIDRNEIEGVKTIRATEDALTGIFKDAAGNQGFMVANAVNPYEKKATLVTIQFDKKYKYQGVQVWEKGVPRIVDLQNNKVLIELEPGEGKFIIPLKKK